MDVKIAISGKSGCGNTTVSTLLAKALGVPVINYTFRTLAAERGMTLTEVLEAAKGSDEFDRYVDTHQVELAKAGACVLGSRLAVWMLKEADLKVYLKASDEVRAARIFEREGGDLDAIKAFTKKRDSEDTARYKALYGIDNDDYGFCDLVIDTNIHKPDQIVDIIMKEIERKKGLNGGL